MVAHSYQLKKIIKITKNKNKNEKTEKNIQNPKKKGYHGP